MRMAVYVLLQRLCGVAVFCSAAGVIASTYRYIYRFSISILYIDTFSNIFIGTLISLSSVMLESLSGDVLI